MLEYCTVGTRRCTTATDHDTPRIDEDFSRTASSDDRTDVVASNSGLRLECVRLVVADLQSVDEQRQYLHEQEAGSRPM